MELNEILILLYDRRHEIMTTMIEINDKESLLYKLSYNSMLEVNAIISRFSEIKYRRENETT